MVGWQDPQGSGALATKAQTSDSSQEPQRNVSKSHGNVFCNLLWFDADAGHSQVTQRKKWAKCNRF